MIMVTTRLGGEEPDYSGLGEESDNLGRVDYYSFNQHLSRHTTLPTRRFYLHMFRMIEYISINYHNYFSLISTANCIA